MNTRDLKRKLEAQGFTELYSDGSYALQGLWAREDDPWHGKPSCTFDVIQVTDLGDACGADGQGLIEAYSTAFDFADRERWLSVFSSMDVKRRVPKDTPDNDRLKREALVFWRTYVALDKQGHKGAAQLALKAKRQIDSEMESSSWLGMIARKDKALARLILAGEFVSYGLSDPAGNCQSSWVAVTDREDESESREKWKENRVYGWGCAAVSRALDNAFSACDGQIWTSAYHPTYDGAGVRNPNEAESA